MRRVASIAVLSGLSAHLAFADVRIDEAVQSQQVGKIRPFADLNVTAMKQYPGSTIIDTELEDAHGKYVYQVELRDTAGKERDIDAGASAGVHGLRLPATFRGTLPCADCEGIRYQLDLWADAVFHLRREWLGESEPLVRDDIGRWSYDAARKALVLRGGAEMPLQFEIKAPDRLRALDMQGLPIDSQLPYDLESDGTLAPFAVAMWLSAELTYLADAARLTECLTGRSYPVALESDYPAMKRAYTAAARSPDGPLYVTFEGEITERPKMEGKGTQPTIVVRKFVNSWPGQRCERGRVDGPLGFIPGALRRKPDRQGDSVVRCGNQWRRV